MWSSSSNAPSARACLPESGSPFRLLPRRGSGVLLLLSLWAAVGAAAPQPEEEAQALLQSYFAALQTGNLAVLGDVLGGDLRASRSGLLKNPDYGAELVQSYSESDFDVIEIQALDSGDILATVDTWLDDSERIRNRLTLKRASLTDRYRIVDSEVVP